ncbi:MAG: Crp/Fnr family transcriptional regulator [Bacteroidetes bacterium]|nr:Crp/Fnr family transcriptional regulator [Bacteroidota bacterium]
MKTENQKTDFNEFVMNGNMLKFLTPEQLNHVNDIQYSVSFNKGENIFKQGAPMPHIIIIEKGMAKVYLEDGNNRSIILKLIKPGEIIGGPGFYTDYKHHFSVTALQDTSAFYIDVIEFKKLVLDNPEFGLKLIGNLNIAHIGLFNKLKTITHKQMNGRLASTLLYLCNNIYDSDSFVTNLTRQDLADMSSMTKESAIRILKDFKTSGIIDCTNNHFKINDKKALLNIIENG